jgi:hypothetical protein
MKKLILILALAIGMQTVASAQMAHIQMGRNLMFQSSLNGNSLAWSSETFNVVLDKWTGELGIDIPIDGLYVKELNPDFKPTGESQGKVFSLRSRIPVDDVLKQGAEAMNVPADTEIYFNGVQFNAVFNYTIIKMFPNGFAVQGEGRFPHSIFGISSLKDAEDELVIVFNFKGQ